MSSYTNADQTVDLPQLLFFGFENLLKLWFSMFNGILGVLLHLSCNTSVLMVLHDR